ncbi:unnamed protein product [Symbiodinium pilosum]|uniref:Uncharacterized protein n=1 Tax=Symbiodinium pilosum TaxID=2952 RepID=A0A812QM69_SYMPI|nr:unnamed protein product [Symbiodinium pilosum]
MDGDVGGADGESSAPAEPRVHGEGQIERSSDEHLRNMLGFHAWAHLTSAAGPEDFFSLTPSQALPVNTESLMLPLQNAVISGHREASRKLPLSLCTVGHKKLARTDSEIVSHNFCSDRHPLKVAWHGEFFANATGAEGEEPPQRS